MATISDTHNAPDDRVWPEKSTTGSSNITLASIAPRQPPTICAST